MPANSSRSASATVPRGRRAPPRPPARARPCASRVQPRPVAARVLALQEEALHARLELLPDPRDGEEPGRLDRRQVADDLARVRAARDRHRVDDRQVVVGHPLGDVGAGQPRDHLRAVGEADQRARRPPWPPSGCGARAGRPSAAPWCRTCRSASSGPRARRRARRLGVEGRVRGLDVGPADGVVAGALEQDHVLEVGQSARAARSCGERSSTIATGARVPTT